MIRLLGKQGYWLTRLAFGVDDRKVEPYSPQNAKSISRELTFQEDVDNVELLRDVLFLLSLCVEHRAKRYGLYGRGVTLKITFADMKSISRSKATATSDSALEIYREAVQLLEQVPRRPIRLIGAGIYNLTTEYERQLSFEDYLIDNKSAQQAEMKAIFGRLQKRYGLDFERHLEDIYRWDTLHKTAEYMRRHFPREAG